ncbi:MAG: DUF2214 family protein [Pseudomonadota bacterium]
MSEVLIRYIHFLGIISFSAALMVECILVQMNADTQKLKRLAAVDGWFGISAMIVLTAGLLLWFAGSKPSPFYSTNWVFHLKIATFGLIALLSIYPTLFFIRNRNNNAHIVIIPSSIVMAIRAELILLMTMPLLAVLMARGYGLSL